MASTSPLSKWLLDNQDAVDLHATRLTWVDDWCPGLTDFLVTMRIDGTVFEGRGTGETEDLAFAKAGAEALERATVCASSYPNSNGFAVHVDEDSAKQCAIEELLERDAFFCHWLTGEPFLPPVQDFRLDINLGDATVRSVLSRLRKLNLSVSVAPMACVHPYNAYICAVSGVEAARPFGVIIGLGCKKTAEDAIRHAVLECLRLVVAWLDPRASVMCPISLEDFHTSPEKGARQHDLYALSLECAEFMNGYFKEAAPASKGTMSFKETDVNCLNVALPTLLSAAPIVAVRAYSPRLQSLFFGYPSEDVVNLARLSHFCGRIVEMNDVRHDPHPLG